MRVVEAVVEGCRGAGRRGLLEEVAVREREPALRHANRYLGRHLDVRLVVAREEVPCILFLALTPDLSRAVGIRLVRLEEIESAAGRCRVRDRHRERFFGLRYLDADLPAVVDVGDL